jgi:flagellar hook protein FlgE
MSMRVSSTFTTALSGVKAAADVLAVSSHNTANLVTEGFVPQRAVALEQASGGVRVRVSSTSPEQPAGTDLVTETVTQLGAAAAYRANLATLETAAELEGVLVRLAGNRNDG